MQPNKVRGVVFDLWRTIVDPGGPRYVARIAAVLNERGCVAVSADDVARALDQRGHLRHARPIDELNDDLWRAFTGAAARAADLSALRDQHRQFVHRARMIPGASQLLDELQHRGVEVAVVSNATVASDAVVERLVIGERVPHVALSCHTGYAKPDPRAFRVVTGRWGLEPADVCVVGDKWETDIAG
ncbi:MAG: HAD family hydrolase, partial [Actinobacteria bacterium]|nr:HAD family hydrolase [Actinomycetota bacterium]